MAEMQKTEVKENESEIVKKLREHYEGLLADKDKIIMDLIDNGGKSKKKGKNILEDDDDAEDDAEDEKKKAETEAEERRKKRMEFYKKHIG